MGPGQGLLGAASQQIPTWARAAGRQAKTTACYSVVWCGMQQMLCAICCVLCCDMCFVRVVFGTMLYGMTYPSIHPPECSEAKPEFSAWPHGAAQPTGPASPHTPHTPARLAFFQFCRLTLLHTTGPSNRLPSARKQRSHSHSNPHACSMSTTPSGSCSGI